MKSFETIDGETIEIEWEIDYSAIVDTIKEGQWYEYEATGYCGDRKFWATYGCMGENDDWHPDTLTFVEEVTE